MPDGKSLDAILTEAAGGPAAPIEPVVEPAATPPVVPPAIPPVVDPTVIPPVTPPATDDPATDPATDPKAGEPKANPIKEIRDKYTSEKASRERIENSIKRFTEGDYTFKLKDFIVDGKMDYDALNESMEDADIKVKAESRGLSPEVQAEIERIERDKIEIEKQKLQISMDRALTNLQLDRGVKSADINNFFKDAMAVQKNPYRWLAQGGDLNDLYSLIYRDKLLKSEVDKAVETAKAKWDEEVRLIGKVPAANPAQPTQKTAPDGSGVSMSALLEEAAKRVR